MKLDIDKVPNSLQSAIDTIVDALDEDDRRYVAANDEYSVHMTIGMGLRNCWSLWDKETHLVQWFISEFKIAHADDISGLILTGVWCKVRSVTFDPYAIAKGFHEHWRRFGVDPITGNI